MLPEAYAAIGLAMDATVEDIKEKFWLRIKPLHPDISKTNDTAPAFIKLREAYVTALRDAKAAKRFRDAPKPLRLYRLVPREKVFRIDPEDAHSDWIVRIKVPADFAASGGLLSIMGTEAESEACLFPTFRNPGPLLPEMRFRLPPFADGYTIREAENKIVIQFVINTAC